MLRSKIVRQLKIIGRHSYSAKSGSQKPNIPSRSSDLNAHFKDEEVLASVHERALFGAVFNKLMKREELRTKNSDEVLSQAAAIKPSVASLHEEADGLQVVFGKKSQEIRPEDRKLFDFFKNTSGSTKLGDIGESAKLTTDDIRNYPVSLISNIFTDAEDVKVPETEKAGIELIKSKTAALEDGVGINTDFKLNVNKEVLEALEAKERFRAAMQIAMQPYLTSVFSRIKTDYDLFILVRNLLESYVERDKTFDINSYKSSTEMVEHIREQCLENDKVLPRPLGVSLPYTLVRLLTSEELDFPSERKFSLISFIYQECKKAKDISLYLNVCNVDFYNLLLELSWDNHREIYQLKQLTTEMSINGIRGDLFTIEILDKIAHDLRHINDGILNEDTGSIEGNPLTVGVIWCRENSTDLQLVENYLRKLKENLA